MPIKVLVADDERHICLEIEYILNKIEDVQLVATCSAGDEALEEICSQEPDIVLLDIEMPGLNGIKLANYLNKIKKKPYIIFVTAYDKYALEAIKIGAKAYLLKPFTEDEVIETINTAIKYLNNYTDEQKVLKQEATSISKKSFARISGELNGKFFMINQEDILMFFAQNRAVYIKTINSKQYLSNFTLTQLEKRLDLNIFFRCHRNYIINLYKVKEVVPWFNSTYLLIMEDEKTEVPVSRKHVKQLKELLGL